MGGVGSRGPRSPESLGVLLGPSLGMALRLGQAMMQDPPRILTKSLGSPPGGRAVFHALLVPRWSKVAREVRGKEFNFLIWPQRES